MFALEAYNEAICAKEFNRAAELATVMTTPLKAVARQIWDRWVPSSAPF